MLVCETSFTNRFPVSQTIVSRTQQFIIVYGPHHSCTPVVCHLRYDRRELRMDIVQMYHIRTEIMEQGIEFRPHFPRTKRPHQCFHHARSGPKLHFRRKIRTPRTFQILGIVHSKNRHLMTVGRKQPLQTKHIDTVATPAVIKFISQYYFHNIKKIDIRNVKKIHCHLKRKKEYPPPSTLQDHCQYSLSLCFQKASISDNFRMDFSRSVLSILFTLLKSIIRSANEKSLKSVTMRSCSPVS